MSASEMHPALDSTHLQRSDIEAVQTYPTIFHRQSRPKKPKSQADLLNSRRV